MALEPITRHEQIIAGKDLEPVTRMEMFLKQYGGGGGSGFEYDFIIKVALDETGKNILFTLEKGTYAQIMEKLGTQTINGSVLVNLFDSQKSDSKAVAVEYVNNKLSVYVMSFEEGTIAKKEFVINQDNTVTSIDI